jgi:CBS domain-containing protein
MTSGVESIPADTTIRNAAEKMASMDVGVLPVVEGEELIGIITDRDICIRAVAEGLDPDATTVQDIMTPHVECCHEDDALEACAELMEQRKIRRVVVVDEDDHVSGIVSLGDIATRSGDRELPEEVLEEVCTPSAPRR